MVETILFAYIASLTVLFVFGSHGFVMIYYYLKYRGKRIQTAPAIGNYPVVTIQLPLYNELYVAGRLID
ncbi:MAG: glycosyl transferase family 2, partial [Bacteroidota bacterium]